MGEYILYKGRTIKIGTCYSLYYVNYGAYADALHMCRLASPERGATPPGYYAQVGAGFIFRFPFPDEDSMPFGDIGKQPNNRAIVVEVPFSEAWADFFNVALDHPIRTDKTPFTLGIYGQKAVNSFYDNRPILATVVICELNGDKYRIESRRLAAVLVAHMRRLSRQDQQNRFFWLQMGLRIASGYGRRAIKWHR